MKKQSFYSCILAKLLGGIFFLAIYSCKSEYYTEADYFKVPKIDAHVHFLTTDASIFEQAAKENLTFITINVNAGENVSRQRDTAKALTKKFPRQINYLATFAFDTAVWNGDNWEEKTIAELENNISGGAVGVKLWKNIGMTEKDRAGNFIMVSNGRFDPVISFIEQKGLPVTGHLGEPRNCWLPTDSMTVNNDKSYFTRHPEYHMYLHPEYPSYQEQLAARDSMLTKHPNLKFIGCHLGSLEWSVDELAKTLDRFPNMAVDLAARICHLQYQSAKDKNKVRDFLIKYQDRILYGTDISYSESKLDSSFFAGIQATRIKDWNYFSGEMELKSRDVDGAFTGLHLPKQVVDKIFYLNTVKWYKLEE
ncbi:MAG: amidohydrolase family protein [Prolixibacteraceae bacterium]|nr:amidohydrolase family protein [Prolixibacteraceae bacterium]